MSTEGAWETKSTWTVRTGIIAGATALAVALSPAVARGEAVTPHAVTPHVVTPHVLSPSPPAEPAPSPAPAPESAPSSESAPGPEPGPAASPSAAESPPSASGPAAATDPQVGQPSPAGGPIASDCPPWQVCVDDGSAWKKYPDSVEYFVFTRLICPLWVAIRTAYENQAGAAQDSGDFSEITHEFDGSLEHARQMSDRYCVTTVIP